MKLIAILFLISEFLSAQLYASCPEVRLDQTTLKNVPILDQDGSGICWSYTASLLIDAYRFSHGDTNANKITSPIALAVRSSYRDSENGNGFGYINLAIARAIQDGGTCDHQAISKFYKSTDFYRTESAEFWTTKPINTIFGCAASDILNRLLGRQTLATTGTFREIELRTIIKEINNICNQGPIKTTQLPSASFILAKQLPGFPNRESVTTFLRNQLSKPNTQPVGISYCEDVLRSKSVRSVDSSGTKKNCKNHHLSAVVGSRTSSNGKCEFLVRNSYGASCNAYAWPCERGQVWVPEEALSNNIEGFSWLE